MTPELIIGDNQHAVDVPEAWLTALERGGAMAAKAILENHVVHAEAPLVGQECVEVALVDDATSARVHDQFMGIPGETDVITFHHGEIVIGVEVAFRQAVENGEPPLRELFRYVVHGLLHLAGHEDEDAADRERMEAAQEPLVAALWPELSGVA
ncbi:MAG: rRNA maturation RNase YbeY [Verrucomicrobia bacterium]|nr:MAG: rRNA maturation RNase YbeY [Verrucomicrobiota bacterium]TAE87715.1 MAG: rRNA maturation RNase YbeY [Verrucomicrobiota bacterium]TAF25352.1 MAG: rRNA maturation RNase YbeY [Verrucomicrobiota bacterium]TAF41139.1 MAG: rRNA maturation RNase YbeY [Verrucomicrobiota bacterium]